MIDIFREKDELEILRDVAEYLKFNHAIKNYTIVTEKHLNVIADERGRFVLIGFVVFLHKSNWLVYNINGIEFRVLSEKRIGTTELFTITLEKI